MDTIKKLTTELQQELWNAANTATPDFNTKLNLQYSVLEKFIEKTYTLGLEAGREEVIERIKESIPNVYDGWSNFGKRDLNEWEQGFNKCREIIRHCVSLLESPKDRGEK